MRIFQVIKKAAASVANEDAAHSSGDAGTVMLGVRNDAAIDLTDTDLDYTVIATDSAGRVRIVASALPLPLGAATAAKQPALGTAGTASADVITVQGIASMTALSVAQATAASLNAQVVGSVAHGDVDAFPPIKIGFKAESALPTAESDNDRVNGIADLFGRQLVAHIDPAMQSKKSYNTTSQQTGADVWTPASGKKIAVTQLIIGTYGTTAGRLILWFGANADTTYTEGTDEALFKGSFAPSATVKPGAVVNFSPPFFAGTADHELHITTDAALSVDVVVVGYEF